MNLLMIDNYDSFTYNIVQYFQELGAHVTVIRSDALTVDEALAIRPDAFIISPGPCSPTEAGISVPLIQRASGHTPILGVCLGHQAIAQAFGGRIVRTGRIVHGKASPVSHRDTDLFANLPNPLLATRYHSLMADPDTLPACLTVTAWTDDAPSDDAPPNTAPRRVIMGLAHQTHPTWGVQFHPESILTTAGKALLQNFLNLAAAHPPAS